MINAIVLDGQSLDGYRLQKQRTITVRVTVTGSGLTGGKLKFVAKELANLSDLDDSGAKILKTTPSQIVVDTDASSSQQLIARFDISPLDIVNVITDVLYWGLQFETSGGVVPFDELQGTLRIENDRVKTLA